MSDFDQRFGGVARLYGSSALGRLGDSHVLVVGLGGVGSWSVESLARSGVGALTLVDLDDVCISNVNRQLPALDGNLGRPKAEVLAERVLAINPGCRVTPVLEFFTEETAERLLAPPGGRSQFSGVLDAIDRIAHKCSLISRCRARGVPIVSCGAAGGRRDATQVVADDLSKVTHDRLLGGVRKRLRQEHSIPRDGKRIGVECVFSREVPQLLSPDGSHCADASEGVGPRRLNCSNGLGSTVFVTGTFGLVAAGRLVERILAGQ